MTIDTQKRVIAIQLRRLAIMIFYIIVFLIIMLFLVYQTVYFGLKGYQWAILWTSLYLLELVVEGLLELKYIFFNDDTDRIILRYFSLGYFNRKKQSIEIPKSDFVGYTIKKSFFGLKKKIKLVRNVKTKEAGYPTVSLTILSAKQIKQLQSTLDMYRIQ